MNVQGENIGNLRDQVKSKLSLPRAETLLKINMDWIYLGTVGMEVLTRWTYNWFRNPGSGVHGASGRTFYLENPGGHVYAREESSNNKHSFKFKRCSFQYILYKLFLAFISMKGP